MARAIPFELSHKTRLNGVIAAARPMRSIKLLNSLIPETTCTENENPLKVKTKRKAKTTHAPQAINYLENETSCRLGCFCS